MEDLWCIQCSGIDVEEFADHAEYKRFLERFCQDEERDNRRKLLYGEDSQD